MSETRTIRVEVTQDDIRNGWHCNPAKCPVARAISRASGRPARVGVRNFRFADALEVDGSPLPSVALLLRQRFDNYHIVSPITFTLEI